MNVQNSTALNIFNQLQALKQGQAACAEQINKGRPQEKIIYQYLHKALQQDYLVALSDLNKEIGS